MGIERNFISDIDHQLAEFEQTHELGDTQQAEVNKYNRINELRDNPKAENQSDSSLWD